jgi:hypothetical protein
VNLRLIREPSKDGATLGSLYVDAVRMFETLEDVIREQPGKPVATWKVKGQTAIPAGRYQVVLRTSPRFGKVLPSMQSVEGFDGVLIHAGNRSVDTEGCVLIGMERFPAEVRRSQVAMQRLMQILTHATDQIVIDIENPNYGGSTVTAMIDS